MAVAGAPDIQYEYRELTAEEADEIRPPVPGYDRCLRRIVGEDRWVVYHTKAVATAPPGPAT